MQSSVHTSDSLTILAEVDWVHRLARALLRDRGLAEDVAQEALLAALERPPEGVDRRGQLRNWLARVTRNHAARVLRQRRDKPSAEVVDTLDDRRVRAPERSAQERLNLHRQLAESALDLDEPYRSTLVMRYFDGLSTEEIATRKGLSRAAVRQQQSRALKQLRGRLDHEFGDRRAWSTAFLATIPDPDSVVAAPSLASLSWSMLVMWKWTAALISLGFFSLWMLPDWGSHPAVSKTVRSLGVSAEPAAPDPARNDIDRVPVISQPDIDTVEPNDPNDETDNVRCTVRDPSGVAVTNALVFAWRKDGTYASNRTDDFGTARFTADFDAVGLVVADPAHPLQIVELERGTSNVEVNLEPGFDVSGKVTRDGHALATDLPLRLSAGSDSVKRRVPLALHTELVGRHIIGSRDLRTDSRGRFEFTGLPRNWTGRLTLGRDNSSWDVVVPVEGCTIESDNVLVLSAPRTQLRVDVTLGPGIRGRIVEAGSLAPVADAWIEFVVKSAVGQSAGGGTYSRPDGTFDFSFDRGTVLKSATISIGRPGRSEEELEFALTPEQLRTGEVGDLTVAATAKLHYVVVDSQGDPIPGAVVHSEQHGRSDASGCGVIPVPEDDNVWVGAFGYRVTRFRLADGGGVSAEAPARFELDRGNALTIRTVDQAGRSLSNTRIELSAEGPIFAGLTHFGSTSVHDAIGRSPIVSLRRRPPFGGSTTCFMRDPQSGDFRFVSMLSGATFSVRMLDLLGTPLASTTARAPAAGEMDAVIELRASDPVADVTLNAMDSNGVAIPGAVVTMRTRRGRAERMTNRVGVARFEALATPQKVDVQVEASGFEPLRVKSFDVVDGVHSVTLQRGRALRIEVFDTRGVRAKATVLSVHLTDPDREVAARLIRPGLFEVTGLPKGKDSFTVSIDHWIQQWEAEVLPGGRARVVMDP